MTTTTIEDPLATEAAILAIADDTDRRAWVAEILADFAGDDRDPFATATEAAPSARFVQLVCRVDYWIAAGALPLRSTELILRSARRLGLSVDTIVTDVRSALAATS